MSYNELLLKVIIFLPFLIVGVINIVPKKIYKDGLTILLLNCFIVLIITGMVLVFDRKVLLSTLYIAVISGSLYTIFLTHDDGDILKETRVMITRVCVGLCVTATGIAIFFFL